VLFPVYICVYIYTGMQRVLDVCTDHAEEIEDLTQEMRQELEALQSVGTLYVCVCVCECVCVCLYMYIYILRGAPVCRH